MPGFIGDVHGKYNQYHNIIKQYPNTIQVGDMGVGFRRNNYDFTDYEYSPNPSFDKMVATNARYLRGNHDNPGTCRNHKQWIADGTIEGDMMFIGGAYSIDKAWRTEGYDWWADEELSHADMLVVYETYVTNKPRMMVTHDMPEFMLGYLHSHHWNISTRTGQFFDRLFEEHRPEIWVHGHHHISSDKTISGCRFVCLAELEYKVIEL